MATVLLLPPSEGKAPGGRGPTWEHAATAFPELAADRVRVRDAVRAALGEGEEAAGRLLGARGPHLARALAEWDALDDARTTDAVARYAGVVWGALDPATLTHAARRRLRAWVMVPSGLWGVSAATDPLPPYRLKMGARVPPLGGLAAFWRPRITPVIAARAGSGWVIDLLPGEHAAAVDPALLPPARLLRVEIVDEGPDGRRAAGHDGKAVKGRLARAILGAGARDPASIGRLDVPGLTLDVSLRSSRDRPARIVFTRTAA